MDFHPIIVHFPIALLVVYAVLELCKFSYFTKKEYWFYLKATSAILGFVTATLASQFGENAEQIHSLQGNKIVELHSTFADISTILFGILAGAYLVSWIAKSGLSQKFTQKTVATLWSYVHKLSLFVLSTWPSLILALLGLIAISITGGLGGVISYGREFDPLMAVILTYFGL